MLVTSRIDGLSVCSAVPEALPEGKTVGATHTRQICDLHRDSGALPQTPLHRLQRAGAGTLSPSSAG